MNTIRISIVWIQSRPDTLSGLLWVQTICKGLQQRTLAGKELTDAASIFRRNQQRNEQIKHDNYIHDLPFLGLIRRSPYTSNYIKRKQFNLCIIAIPAE